MRDHRIDIAKGTACLLMVQVHVMSLFMEDGLRLGLVGDVSRVLGGPLVAPLFLSLFGYFLLIPGRPAGSIVKRGVGLLLLGLGLNVGLNAHLFYRILFDGWAFSPWSFLLGVDLLPSAGLCALLLAGVARLSSGRLRAWVYLSLLIVVPVSETFVADAFRSDGGLRYASAFIAGDYPWSYFPVFPWLAYLALGGLVRELGDAGAQVLNWRQWGLVVALIVMVLLLPHGWEVAGDLKAYYHHGPLFLVWTTSILCGVVLSARHISRSNKVSVYLAWIGRRVTRFYVFQWLLIGNLATAIYQTQAAWSFLPWVILVVGVSTALLWVMERVRPI